MNPAEKMLNEYGFTTRHPIRTPVAGFYPAEIPEEVRKEWEIEFGKQRQRYLANLVRLYQDGALQTKDYEKVRKMIQKADSMAAKVATTRVNMRHVGRPKVRLPRRMTPREKALPSFIWENRQ